MDEINKFSKRVARYANLGTSAGSIALKFLGTRLLNKEHEKNAEDLKNILGNLKGPIMKLPNFYQQFLTYYQKNM